MMLLQIPEIIRFVCGVDERDARAAKVCRMRPETEKEGKRMKKAFLIIAGVFLALCLVGVLGIAALLRTMPKDIGTFNDSALRRPAESLPEDQNAFTLYLAAAEAMQRPDDEDRFIRILGGEDWDSDFVRSILVSNAECFEHVRHGNRLERCLAPRLESFDALMPHLAHWRAIARLFSVKADYHQRQGQPEEALAAVSDLLQFAYLLEADAVSIIHYLVGTALREMALHRVRGLIWSGIPDERLLLQLCEALGEHPPSTQGLVSAMQGEYETFANLIEAMAAGEIPEDEGPPIPDWLGRLGMRYFIHPNRSKRDMAMFIEEIIDQVERPYAQTHLTDFEAWSEAFEQTLENARGLAKLRVPNIGGTLLVLIAMPSNQRSAKRRCNSQVSHRATLLIAALHAFRAGNGRFPQTLDELVPGILPEIPLDPYDGKVMRYSHEKGIVYSVGENLVDSGGSREPLPGRRPMTERRRQYEAEDIVFDVEGKAEDGDAAAP